MALLGMVAGSMSLPHPSDGRLVTILVACVRGRDVWRFADLSLPDAAVLLFVMDSVNRAGIPIAWLMDAYDLTQAEARVALAASSGMSIPEAAIQLGLSVNTIKTTCVGCSTKPALAVRPSWRGSWLRSRWSGSMVLIARLERD
jgi:hypothetical protein